MKVPFLDLKAQHDPLLSEITESVMNVIADAAFILGSEVSQLEEEFAAWCGAKYAVGVDNGLSALKLLLMAHGIGEGDEVIVPTNSFIASAAAVTFAGATPVLVDCDPDTLNIDIDAIKSAITPNTKAIMPVHLYGCPADMDPILAIAEEHNLLVFEDAAQAHGAMYKGRMTGNLADGAGFSFYPGKNLGAGGDAGIATTNDPEIAERMKALRNCGQYEKGIHVLPPNNHRLDNLQAAILRIKLRHIENWNRGRQRVAALYDQYLAGVDGVIAPKSFKWAESVWHVYAIQLENRDAFRRFMDDKGVGTGIHYPVPIHLAPYYADLGYTKGQMPVAETVAEKTVSLPMYPELTEEQVRYVVEQVKAFLAQETVGQPVLQ